MVILSLTAHLPEKYGYGLLEITLLPSSPDSFNSAIRNPETQRNYSLRFPLRRSRIYSRGRHTHRRQSSNEPARAAIG